MGKFEIYFDEAEKLHVQKAKSLEEIAQLLPVSVQTLSKWKNDGQWAEKRKAALRSPRTIAEALRDALEQKLEKIAAQGDFTAADADEMSKISCTIERLEKGGYSLLAATVEVMGRFGEFVKKTQPGLVETISPLLQDFFKSIEES